MSALISDKTNSPTFFISKESKDFVEAVFSDKSRESSFNRRSRENFSYSGCGKVIYEKTTCVKNETFDRLREVFSSTLVGSAFDEGSSIFGIFPCDMNLGVCGESPLTSGYPVIISQPLDNRIEHQVNLSIRWTLKDNSFPIDSIANSMRALGHKHTGDILLKLRDYCDYPDRNNICSENELLKDLKVASMGFRPVSASLSLLCVQKISVSLKDASPDSLKDLIPNSLIVTLKEHNKKVN